MPIDLEAIKNRVLDENVGDFGTEEGIYLCTRLAKVHLVTNLNDMPQQNLVCNGSAATGGYSMLDIAINQDEDMYVAANDVIYKIDNTNCGLETVYNFGLGNSITSLSFDRNRNIYMGGFDTSVYRLNNGNYGTMNLWHNFQQGSAAGDFVMCKDKMYVAWRLTTGCRLYEVTVDANTNYMSHIDLGGLPDNTFGLASELGNLYGVTPFQLYKINQSPLTFTPILSNTDAGDDWYGAAGKNEAVNFEVSVFDTPQNAQYNVNPLPSLWTNTVAFGQMVYVVIRNMVNNQITTVPVQLVINVAPSYTNPVRLSHCAGDGNAQIFDIRTTEAGIKGAQQHVVVTYHNTLGDAVTNVNPLPDVVTTNGSPKTVYVRLTNAVTGCYSTFDFMLEVAPKPIFNQPGDLTICALNVAFVALNEQVPAILGSQNPEGLQITFHDSAADAFSGIHPLAVPYQMNNGVKEIFVRIENTSNGCFDTGSFHVKARSENHETVIAYQVSTTDWTYDENTIQVTAAGHCEYSLDGITYQDSPYFGHLAIGEYQLHVRDKDNCSVAVKDIFLLMYPKYFTPNGDDYHDLWNIMQASYEPKMETEIYDRYGKLITVLKGTDAGWDGKLNGKALPATDYWFSVTRENGKKFKGHFTLKR